MFDRTALPDGPRVITARLPGARALAVSAYVLAGSRLETRRLSGVAHFMEHVTFKGTEGYPTTRAVSEAIEGVGGTSNAATDRESTVYWARLPVREAERAVNVLADLIVRPLLRDEDIDREREIIVDEIRSYRDDPGQYVFNVFDEALFGDSPLGWEIAGDEASVRGLPTEEIRTFWRRMYQPANVIVAVAGDLEHATVVDLVASAFGQGNGVVGDYAPAPKLPNGERLTVVERQTAQAYLCLGVPALPRDHADTWTLELLNTVLGDGSSSRLFLTIREDAGLAYDVHSFQTDYSDCGTLQVYAGVDPGAVQPTVRAVLVELARLRDEAVPPDQLARARAYARGHMELRLEETRHLAAWLGVQEALHDRVLSLDEAISALDAVTADDIQRLAQQLFRDELLTMAVVAPPGGLPALDKALRLP